MPSKKKARGRQNRAKKEATRTADQRSLWEPIVNIAAKNKDAIPCCEHVAILPRIPQVGPAVSFMNRLAGEGFFDKAARFPTSEPVELCFQALSRFPRVVEEESERSLAMDLLLRFVRNVFLNDYVMEGENLFHQCHDNEVAICGMIHTLELLVTYSNLAVVERRATKTSNMLVCGNRRDVVKFVAKRLPCICLKKLHSAVRMKVAKVGKCTGCHKRFPRSELFVCTGCMITDYCSKECQRANWSIHKRLCGYSEVMSRDLPADYVLRYDR